VKPRPAPPMAWLALVLVLGAAGGCRDPGPADGPATREAAASVERTVRRPPYTEAELRGFLDTAYAAEQETDPLRRCLAYPDPPGSHWNRAAVEAYCRYRTVKVLGADEIIALAGAGKAAEVDRRMAKAFAAQKSDPHARGMLDQTYFQAFEFQATPELRHAVDAWKRALPRSAFARSASGWLYVQAAYDAAHRHDGKAMDNALALARADLAAAQQLDPAVTVTYIAMLRAAAFDGDGRRAAIAAREGVEADPSDYAIQGMRMDRARPDPKAMQAVAEDMRPQVPRNPMLELLLNEPAAEAAGVCGCRGDTAPDGFRDVLDQVAPLDILREAGSVAAKRHLDPVALMFRSEEARFVPENFAFRYAQFESVVVLSRRDPLEASANRLALVLLDRLAALPKPDPAWLAQVGQHFAYMGAWDRAWNVAETLVRDHPDRSVGWVLRAQIQAGQPRPGLRDTAQYLVEHFANDPEARGAVAQARAELARTPPASPP